MNEIFCTNQQFLTIVLSPEQPEFVLVTLGLVPSKNKTLFKVEKKPNNLFSDRTFEFILERYFLQSDF